MCQILFSTDIAWYTSFIILTPSCHHGYSHFRISRAYALILGARTATDVPASLPRQVQLTIINNDSSLTLPLFSARFLNPLQLTAKNDLRHVVRVTSVDGGNADYRFRNCSSLCARARVGAIVCRRMRLTQREGKQVSLSRKCTLFSQTLLQSRLQNTDKTTPGCRSGLWTGGSLPTPSTHCLTNIVIMM